jgi:hypothetical protein
MIVQHHVNKKSVTMKDYWQSIDQNDQVQVNHFLDTVRQAKEVMDRANDRACWRSA